MVLAAKLQVGDSSGGTPTPADGSTVEVSFNPTVTLTVQPREVVDVLMRRLAQAINNASAGLYTAQVTTPTLLEILRTGGGEIDDLRFIESDPGIQSVLLTVGRPQLIARIGAIVENPSSGMILLTLNNRTVAVATTGLQNGAAVTDALVKGITQANFAVEFDPPFIVVSRDLLNGTGLTQLGLRSTDPAIVSSDLSLIPDPTATTTASAGRLHRPHEGRVP